MISVFFFKAGKPLKDELKLSDLSPKDGNSLKLYFKDLGPQVGWTTVRDGKNSKFLIK